LRDRVIARNSSFVYNGRSVDLRDAAKQLGVQYILEGSVRY
jgi:Predicted integral membrane protein